MRYDPPWTAMVPDDPRRPAWATGALWQHREGWLLRLHDGTATWEVRMFDGRTFRLIDRLPPRDGHTPASDEVATDWAEGVVLRVPRPLAQRLRAANP